jgi:carbon-monoxide dehydrogenase medium subunit
MKLAPFAYYAPRTVTDAVALLSRLSSDDGRIIAGGQSLLPMMAFRLARPRHLIDINLIADLSTLAIQDGALSIGATVRHSAFEEPIPGGGQLGRMLAEIAHNIAHAPIRSRGTFCGSVANADPASEWSLVTVATEGEIVAQSARGVRTIAARSFFTGVMTNRLEPDELVVRTQIKMLPDDTRFGFCEISRRAGDFAMAAAVVFYRIVNGRITEPTVAVGAVEPQPRRISDAEGILDGNLPDGSLFDEAAAASSAIVEPMDDEHIPGSYRRELVEAVVRRALERSLS